MEKEHKQPDYLSPLSCGLTPNEIIESVAIRITGATTSYESLMDDDAELLLSAENPRTGFSCTLSRNDTVNAENESMISFLVELNVDSSFVLLYWDCFTSEGDGSIVAAQQFAHESFIRACAVIGIRCAYALCVAPDMSLVKHI